MRVTYARYLWQIRLKTSATITVSVAALVILMG